MTINLFDSLTFNPPISSFVGEIPWSSTLSWSYFMVNATWSYHHVPMPIATSWKTTPRSWASVCSVLRNGISSAWSSRNSCFVSNHLSRCVLIGALFDKLILPFSWNHEDEGPTGIHLQPGIVILVFVCWSLLLPSWFFLATAHSPV